MRDPSRLDHDVPADAYAGLQARFSALQEQFDAANEVLSAVGRSAGDPDTVLTTIVESARRLCRSDVAQLYLLDDDNVYQLIKAVGLSEEAVAYVAEHPMPLDRDTLIGRVGLDRSTQQIPDVVADPDYGRLDLQRVAGFRTTMGAPLVVDDRVVGGMIIWRNEVSPFNEREMAIVTAFAGQAAMALNGVTLVQELQAGRRELARKVGELEALRQVGEAVSSSLDVERVLSTIARHAVELSDTAGGSILEYDVTDRRFEVRSVYGTSPEVVERLHAARIDVDSSLVGRSARERRPVAVPDLRRADLDPHLRILLDDGWRSLVAVPILREEQIIGSLVVRRRETGDFSSETLDLLSTFASQSSIALLNAQLFSALHERSAQLEAASRHKSEFLASMSHELRTPLNAVLGFSEVLLERMFGDLNERQEDYLHDIHDSGQHLLELLNEILDLSKVEAGQMELVFTAVDVPAVLEYARSMLRERAAAHAIDLRVETGPGLGSVEADELRLKQVVLNLVSNAVKFTPDRGSVLVRGDIVDGQLQVAVTDTGMGVPAEDQERIFQSFQQGGRGTPHEEGTGLGLTLSRRIVELFGGRMWLHSEVGVGSTFCFAIPARRGSTRKGHPDPPEPASASILIIEDDRRSLDLLTAYLAGTGVQVTTAQDGLSGLDAVQRRPPDAVILDIRLPGLSGWGVLQELKKDPATRHIPVIIVSIVDERARGAALGAAAYLVKPLSRDALVTALAHVAIHLPGTGARSP
jgi:signal transduction histidine kinase/CheY-like chemotaxis protein